MFDRPKTGEKTLLVQVSLDRVLTNPDLEEFNELAISSGADIIDSFHVIRKIASPKYLIGRGKVDEIKCKIDQESIELILFNATLTPSQERNLESIFCCRVIDRTGLILDIFAQRARTYEGKLQVELAQLKHLSTRLIRGWTHLERQKGGIGLRGPGETQLETDRRLLAERVKQIDKRLNKVSAQRQLVRSYRKKSGYPIVSVVGYTNAGKSTLFNLMTDSKVYAEDKLFATLDVTLRRLSNDSSDHVFLADTVGFVSNLPHELIAAFQATLQETIDANLLLHVIDSSDPEHIERERNVYDILKKIGAGDTHIIRVYNKIDLTGQKPQVLYEKDSITKAVFVSSLTGEGVSLLKDEIVNYFYGKQVVKDLKLMPNAAKLRNTLYEEGNVLSEEYNEDGTLLLQVLLSESRVDLIQNRYKKDWNENKNKNKNE